jgi:hypothetical protein
MLHILASLIYLLWLGLPLLALAWLWQRPRRQPASPSSDLPHQARAFVRALLIAAPAYCALPLALLGAVWPPDYLTPGPDTYLALLIPSYQVAFVQYLGGIADYETYFEITQPDGRQARYSIDIDAKKCWAIRTQQVGPKIYFLCGGEAITERTSYVDSEDGLVYSGYYQTNSAIRQLEFEKPRQTAGAQTVSDHGEPPDSR